MAKHQYLDIQRGSRSEQSNQPVPDQFAERDHRAEASPDSRLIASRIRFATGTGGKDRLGSISKQGDRYLRSLFVAGALAVIRYAKIHGTKHRLCVPRTLSALMR